MAEEITIRLFEPNDQGEAQRLILNGIAEHFPQIDRTLNLDLQNIGESYPTSSSTFLVAVSGNEIVGTGALVTETEDTARIVRVSVANAHRRKGIGRKLTAALLRTARESGFAAVVVETNDNWYGALKLYQECGFVEYDRHNEEVHMMLHL